MLRSARDFARLRLFARATTKVVIVVVAIVVVGGAVDDSKPQGPKPLQAGRGVCHDWLSVFILPS
jgi:hypothetical protein